MVRKASWIIFLLLGSVTLFHSVKAESQNYPLKVESEKGPPQLAISKVVANGLNTTHPTLAIEGRNFGRVPSVFMGASGGLLVSLTVLSSSDSYINAQLNSQTSAPGSYLLVVARGPSANDISYFNVTLESVNSQTAAGPTGPTGPTGPSAPSTVSMLFSTGGSNLSNNAFVGVGGIHGAPEGTVQQVMSVAGHFTALSCFMATTSTSAQTFTLRVNGANTTLTCTIPVGSLSGSTTGASIAFSPGNLVDIACPTSGTNATPGSFALTVGP